MYCGTPASTGRTTDLHDSRETEAPLSERQQPCLLLSLHCLLEAECYRISLFCNLDKRLRKNILVRYPQHIHFRHVFVVWSQG
jgi:hypothetical protein